MFGVEEQAGGGGSATHSLVPAFPSSFLSNTEQVILTFTASAPLRLRVCDLLKALVVESQTSINGREVSSPDVSWRKN